METELTCAVCSDVYLEGKREPVTLPECGHTFCRQCLLNVEKSGSLSCPYCRAKHHGPPVSQMSTVYAILNLTKFLRRSKFGVCDGHSATLDFWCQTCGKGLCGFCLYEGHMKEKHQIVIMKNAMDEKKEDLQKVGQQHLEQINNTKKQLLNELHDHLARISSLCDNTKSLTTSVREIKELMEDANNSFNMELIHDALEKMEEYQTLFSEDSEENEHGSLSLTRYFHRPHQHTAMPDSTRHKEVAGPRAIRTQQSRESESSSRGQDNSHISSPSSDYDNDDERYIHIEAEASAHLNGATLEVEGHELSEGEQTMQLHPSMTDIAYYPAISSPPVLQRNLSDGGELLDGFMSSEENSIIINALVPTVADSIIPSVYTSQGHGNDLTDSEDGSDMGGLDRWLKWSARSDDGREGRLRWEDGRLHLYTLTSEPQDVHASVKFSVILSLLPNSPEVFLDFGADGVCFGRVYIRIWGELRRAHHFLILCVGSMGPSYKGSRCSKVEGKDKPGECLRVNHYITAEGIMTARGLIDGLEWSGEYSAVKKEGLVVAASGGKSEYDGCFDICTRGNPAKKFSCPFGEVVSGLTVVKEATCHEPIGDLIIMNAGVVVIDQKS